MFSVFSLHAKSFNYKDPCPAADRKFFMQSGQLLKLFASQGISLLLGSCFLHVKWYMNWTEIWHDKWQKFNWHWKDSSQLGSCRVKTRTSDLNPWSQLSLSYSKRWIKRLAAKMCLLWFNRLERFSYELAKWFRSVFVIFFLSANGWKVQNIATSFSRQRKH